jgi:hypothetical protein
MRKLGQRPEARRSIRAPERPTPLIEGGQLRQESGPGGRSLRPWAAAPWLPRAPRADPTQPAYTQTLGWKLANWLD